jgi:hypothetical protein
MTYLARNTVNGQAEQMVSILKKHMQRSIETKSYSHKEICTLLQETAQIINNYLLAGGEGLVLCPQTPADPMGTSMAGVPSVQFERGVQLTGDFRHLSRLKTNSGTDG